VSKVLAIARREVGALFASPLAYVLAAAFLFAEAYFFNVFVRYYARSASMLAQQSGGLEQLDLHAMVILPLLSNVQFLMLVLVPFLTMRTLAEERRQETLELLFTSPVSTAQVVLGKFLGNLWTVTVLLALSMAFPLFLAARTGLDWGPLLSGYLGLLLLSSAFIAVGMFFSSLTRHQIVAGVLSFLGLTALWVLGLAAQLFDDQWRGLMEQATFARHFQDFARGVVDSHHVVYFVSFTCFFLFLTHRWLDSERWR
jgi:ABC-2 type transport system permease protein